MTAPVSHLPTSPFGLTPAAVPVEVDPALLALGVSKAVFDCKWPETRALLDTMWGARPHDLGDLPYLGRQEGIEDVFLDAWRAWAAPVARIDTDALRHRYATLGSTEAIRESIAVHIIGQRCLAQQPVIHVFEGEYEGYAAQAEAYGAYVRRHRRDRYVESLRDHAAGDRFYLSQPSAIDGNVWDGFDAFVRFVETECPGLKLMVDLTYLGTVARPYAIDCTSPVVDTVFFSLSKVFGVYYHRIGGAWTRRALPGLYGNCWFKHPFSLALGAGLVTRYGVHELPRQYAPLQAQAVAAVAATTGFPVQASDAVVLAHHPASGLSLPPEIRALARGPADAAIVRYCLSPMLERLLAAPDASY